MYFEWSEEFLANNICGGRSWTVFWVIRGCGADWILCEQVAICQHSIILLSPRQVRMNIDGPTRSSYTIVSKDGRRSWIVIWVIRFVFYFICTRASVAGTIDNAATLVSPTAQPFSAGAFYCIPSIHKTHHRVARTDGCRRRTSWQEARATQSHPMSERWPERYRDVRG
jgi:hypothetical protein